VERRRRDGTALTGAGVCEMDAFVATEVNVVVLANSHNPTIVTKDWLTQHRVVPATVSKFLNTPALSVVEYEDDGISIQVEAPRLIVTQRAEGLDFRRAIVPEIVKTYVGLLPHTPYTAHGVNVEGYLKFDSAARASAFLRERFLAPGSIRLKGLEPKDLTFAVKIGYPCGNDRCTLAAEPAAGNGYGKIGIHFNYHVAEPGVDAIRRTMESTATIWEILEDAIANFGA